MVLLPCYPLLSPTDMDAMLQPVSDSPTVLHLSSVYLAVWDSDAAPHLVFHVLLW